MRNAIGNFAIALAFAAVFGWVGINAITGCDRLDPDACVMVPWIGR